MKYTLLRFLHQELVTLSREETSSSLWISIETISAIKTLFQTALCVFGTGARDNAFRRSKFLNLRTTKPFYSSQAFQVVAASFHQAILCLDTFRLCLKKLEAHFSFWKVGQLTLVEVTGPLFGI